MNFSSKVPVFEEGKRETVNFSSKVPVFEYNCRFGGGRGAKRGFVNLDGKCGNRGCPEVHNSL